MLPSRAVGLAVLAGRVVLARGWLCVPVAALFLGSRPALRFCRGAFPRFTPAVCLATNRTACDILRSYSAGSKSPFVRSRGVSAVICLCWFTSGLAVSLWRSRRGAGDVKDGERGWRRGACASLRNRIGLVSLSAGRTLGLRAPDCAKESSTLWTLLTLRRDCVGAYSPRRRPGTRKDPPESNLCSGGSGCIAIISTRTIGDLPDSDLWSGRSCITARQQVEPAAAARKMWKRHCRRVACAKRCRVQGIIPWSAFLSSDSC